MSNNDVQFLVKVLIIAAVSLVATIDLVLLARFGPAGTISVVLRHWGETFPLLPYLVAFGAGAFVYHIAYH